MHRACLTCDGCRGDRPGSPGLDVTLDILFMLDVVIKLHTTYTERGIEVLEPNKV